MADTKRAISVDSLQATTDLLNQLTADAQAIIDTLNQTGGVAPVWINTNVPPNTVGGYDNINPATDVNGLEFAAAMNKLLFPSIAPLVNVVISGTVVYLEANPQFSITVTSTPQTAGATIANISIGWKRQYDAGAYDILDVATASTLNYNFKHSDIVGSNNTSNLSYSFEIIVTDSAGAIKKEYVTKAMSNYSSPTISIGTTTDSSLEVGAINRTFSFKVNQPNVNDLVTSGIVEILSGTTVIDSFAVNIGGDTDVNINTTQYIELYDATSITGKVRLYDNNRPNTGNGTAITFYNGTAKYKQFYGAGDPTMSTNAIRALTSNFEGTTTFSFDTGVTSKNFYVFVPNNRTLVSATNLTNNSSIPFELIAGTTGVPDGGGTSRQYKQYKYTIATPYSPANNIQVIVS